MDIKETLEEIKKKYGKGAILQIGEVIEDIPFIPTPSLSLNDALGIGGFPRGRIVEIHGQESVGKSSLAAHIVANAQKEGCICAYIDSEHAVDLAYFEKLGIKTFGDKFLLSQPDSGEEGLDILEYLLKTEQIGVIVVDSVASLTPKAELDGEIEDSTIALQARMMSKCMRRITSLIKKSNTCVIFINQLRENVGTFGYGPKYSTPGGKALKYYASIRIELTRTAHIKDGEEIIGSRIKAKIVKNKVSSPFREAEYDLISGEGISQERELLEIGSKKGFITKSGAWFGYKDKMKVAGMEKARQFLKDNPEVKDEILSAIKSN